MLRGIVAACIVILITIFVCYDMVETVRQAALTPVNDLRGGLPRDFTVMGTVWNVVVVR